MLTVERTAQLRRLLLAAGAVVLLLMPLLGDVSEVRLITRILIFALLAVSLDIILGYTGLVSFGHAAFFGVGAYATGILAFHGVQSGFIHFPVSMLAGALVAVVIGWICVRTRGLYFIMITLAFAQMLYYFFISLRTYGRDDGMRMDSRSDFAGLIDLSDHVVFYYGVLALLTVTVVFVYRGAQARFGWVLRGIESNEARMQSLGFEPFRYKLAAFVIAGAIAGLAGALIANQTQYIAPAYLHWTVSGTLIIMVVLGGQGTVFGPIIGAFVFLLAEEILSGITLHWWVLLGPLLILFAIFAERGIIHVLSRRHP